MDKHKLQYLAEEKGYNDNKDVDFAIIQRALQFAGILLWLREVHGIYIMVAPRYRTNEGKYIFNYFIFNWKNINRQPFTLSGYENHDECMYAAIEKAIELI